MEEVELLKKCIWDKHMCNYCDGSGWCIKEFTQEVRNEYVLKGYGCICGVDCRKVCPNGKECCGEED